jgi:hypothetical protein
MAAVAVAVGWHCRGCRLAPVVVVDVAGHLRSRLGRPSRLLSMEEPPLNI